MYNINIEEFDPQSFADEHFGGDLRTAIDYIFRTYDSEVIDQLAYKFNKEQSRLALDIIEEIVKSNKFKKALKEEASKFVLLHHVGLTEEEIMNTAKNPFGKEIRKRVLVLLSIEAGLVILQTVLAAVGIDIDIAVHGGAVIAAVLAADVGGNVVEFFEFKKLKKQLAQELEQEKAREREKEEVKPYWVADGDGTYWVKGTGSIVSGGLSDSYINFFGEMFQDETCLMAPWAGGEDTVTEYISCHKVKIVHIGPDVTEIRWGAFGGCCDIESIHFASADTMIYDGIFGSEWSSCTKKFVNGEYKFTVHAPAGGAVEEFARKHNLEFVLEEKI